MQKAPNRSQDYRYERKFVISELDRYEVEALIKLHPAMFSELYQPRFVNNIYLDNQSMKHYVDAIDGSNNRLKVRIRWYGDLFGVIEKPVLELKIKDGLLGRKTQYPLIPLSFDTGFQLEKVVDLFNGSEIPDALRLDLCSLKVSLLNRYKRKYLQSADRKFRITIDSEMEFYRITSCNNSFLHRSVDHTNTVMELKYDQAEERHAAAISSWFPFRMTKSSKYVNGIERICL